MTATKPHHSLIAWQEAMALVQMAYGATSAFPRMEQYGLTSQIRRAAVAVPSNLAEGAGRSGSREFAHFLSIARGSLSELETELLIAVNLGYMNREHVIFPLLERVSRLITGLRAKTIARS